MSHLLNYHFLTAKTREQAMKEGIADAEEFAYYNGDREEGTDTYHYNFDFYNEVFDTEDEAIAFFDSLGPYEDGVCMVREASKSAQDKFNKIYKRNMEKKEKFEEKALENFKERKSASVGCKQCGTRITSEVAIKNNLKCPNCHNWLAPNSYKEKLKKLNGSLESAQKTLNKARADGKPKYYVKYEIHC